MKYPRTTDGWNRARSDLDTMAKRHLRAYTIFVLASDPERYTTAPLPDTPRVDDLADGTGIWLVDPNAKPE